MLPADEGRNRPIEFGVTGGIQYGSYRFSVAFQRLIKAVNRRLR